MKHLYKNLTVLFVLVLLVSLLCLETNALTVYSDGEYKYAELENGFVALYDCEDSVSDIVINDCYAESYVYAVYEYAFFRNKNIHSIDFSKVKHLNYIDTCAFSECSNLSCDIKLPSSLRYLGVAAFQNTSITSVSTGNSLTVIPAQCFNNCRVLSKVTLSANTEIIESMAFANCPELESVYIPDSVSEIDSSAFKNSNNVLIVCYPNSYALDYAQKKGIKYSIIKEVILGDVNGNGVVDINDATQIQKYKAGIKTLSKTAIRAADVTGDGEVSVRDATQIQRYLASIITEF